MTNADGDICRMVGGDPYEAWLEGTKEVYNIQKVPFKQKADVSFACAGGYPKDVSLYQGCKCYDPAEAATKEGGIIIAIMEARDIMEPAEYMGSFKYGNDEEDRPDPRGDSGRSVGARAEAARSAGQERLHHQHHAPLRGYRADTGGIKQKGSPRRAFLHGNIKIAAEEGNERYTYGENDQCYN